MREGFKAFFAVITAYARSADAAERDMRGRDVYNGVVDATAAERHARQYPLFRFFARRKQVQRKRRGVTVYYLQKLRVRFVRKHRQDRTEYFLLHGRAVDSGGVNDGRLYFSRFVVECAAVNDFAADKAFNAPVMPFADYFAVSGVFERVRVLFGYVLFKACDELVGDAFVSNNVVGRDAGLSDVEKLAERYAFGGKIDLCRSVDDSGAFAAKFERDGGKAGCGGGIYLCSHFLAAREKYVVEFVLQDFVVYRICTVNACREFGRKYFVYYLLHDRARASRCARRL